MVLPQSGSHQAIMPPPIEICAQGAAMSVFPDSLRLRVQRESRYKESNYSAPLRSE